MLIAHTWLPNATADATARLSPSPCDDRRSSTAIHSASSESVVSLARLNALS